MRSRGSTFLALIISRTLELFEATLIETRRVSIIYLFDPALSCLDKITRVTRSRRAGEIAVIQISNNDTREYVESMKKISRVRR
jgi:hypothetical protein